MSDPTVHDPQDRSRTLRTEDDVRAEGDRRDDRVAPTARQEAVSAPAATRHDRDERADRLGGIRWGAVFFGWLCAMGVAVLLVAVVAATGTAIGLTESTVDDVVDGAVGNAGAVSVGGAIALVVVLAVSYLAGGYVAARMARFSGRTQGFAVWVLGLVVTILVALAGVLLGSAYDVLARLDLPRIPVDEGTATTGGVITLVAVLLVTLLAAVLGGTLGDRYHRRLDEIDLR
jgi:ABC-type Fe3+ transport system permease subunit